ncbi:MAG TPA: nitroreductase family protein, partial [Vicinamibacterales bacterium]|nr:nitroreductase family protein [Vicinamibacterales bacterium]
RSYTGDLLDRSVVRSLLDAAVRAPTAMHAEPWMFVVVQDGRLLEQLSDRAKAAWAAEARRFQDLHRTKGEGPAGGFADRMASPGFSVFYDAGTLIVICGRAREPFAAADCWLAAENLMLAATALGLGTCCIGSAVSMLNESDIKATLRIPPDVTAVAPIIVGVPKGVTPSVPRKPPEILYWT